MKLNISLAERPAHVRPEQVVDFDFFGFDAADGDSQWKMVSAFHSTSVPDVFWTPRNSGHWVAARADALEKVLTSPDLFSSSQFMVIKEMNPDPPLVPLMLDAPDHSKYRSLLTGALSPGAVQKLSDRARALAIELIESFVHKGACEFIGDFATHLPVTIFMSMVDWPMSDRSRLMEIAELVVRPGSFEAAIAGKNLVDEYAQSVVATRRGTLGNDLISDLLRARVDGKPIPEQILNGMVKLLLTAGLDTVASSMGFQARHLALSPELRARLIAHPEIIPKAIEEMLRRFPIGNLGRKVTQDCEFFGAQLKSGDTILAPTASFGLDDRKFESPDRVNVDRPAGFHLSFGAGPHRCVGAMLARTELRIFVEEWLKRIPNFRIAPGASINVASGFVFGIPKLPLVWDVN